MQPKAEPWKRIVAYIIDVLIIAIIATPISVAAAFMGNFMSYVGSIVASAAILVFVLCRDALPIEALKGSSPGKMVFGIRAQTMNGQVLDFETSARRNAPLAVGAASSLLANLLDFIPVLPLIISSLGGLAALGLAIFELVQLFNDVDNRRWGDRFADTIVREAGSGVFEGSTGATPPPPAGTATSSTAPPPPPQSGHAAPPPPPPGGPSAPDEEGKKSAEPSMPPPPPVNNDKED